MPAELSAELQAQTGLQLLTQTPVQSREHCLLAIRAKNAKFCARKHAGKQRAIAECNQRLNQGNVKACVSKPALP
jgi:hypothetical protein